MNCLSTNLNLYFHMKQIKMNIVSILYCVIASFRLMKMIVVGAILINLFDLKTGADDNWGAKMENKNDSIQNIGVWLLRQ